MKDFYQSRKSQRNVSVTVMASRVPLYGGGAGLSSTPGPKGAPPAPVPVAPDARMACSRSCRCAISCALS